MAPPGFEGVTRVADPKALQAAAKAAAAAVAGGHALPPGANPLLVMGAVLPGVAAGSLPGPSLAAVAAAAGLPPMVGGAPGFIGNPTLPPALNTLARQSRRLYVGNLPDGACEVCCFLRVINL